MTFTELCNEVYTLTNRPDLIAETKVAVKAATLKMHQSDYYYKDLYEFGVSFPTSEYVQSLEYKFVLPNWRALKYIRKTDVVGSDTDSFLTVLTPEETVDSYGMNKNDICYVAGQVIQIRSSTQLQYIFVGCYTNPTLVEASYNSWIASDHPYAIVYDAVATIFKMTGFDEQATLMRQLVAEQIAELRLSNIQASGY
jgi:hypothetical protein